MSTGGCPSKLMMSSYPDDLLLILFISRIDDQSMDYCWQATTKNCGPKGFILLSHGLSFHPLLLQWGLYSHPHQISAVNHGISAHCLPTWIRSNQVFSLSASQTNRQPASTGVHTSSNRRNLAERNEEIL